MQARETPATPGWPPTSLQPPGWARADVFRILFLIFYFMRIAMISIAKGYDESERLRKRRDYPQLGAATYCVFSHGGCVLCL
nr:hypothetical protein [Tanacetum cinerariifolium]